MPAGNPDGGRWAGGGVARIAGGFEEDDKEEPGRRDVLEDYFAPARRAMLANSIQELRRLEPTNPRIPGLSDGSAPSRSIVEMYQREVEAARTRVAEKITLGHAFDEHANEFGISNRAEFIDTVRQTISAPDTQARELERGRTGFYNARSNTIVFIDPLNRDGGTMFKPKRGQAYFDEQ